MKKINYYSYNIDSGYGTAALGYIHLINKRLDVKLNHYIRTFAENKIRENVKTFEGDADIHFIHMIPMEGTINISPISKNIISTVYEADKLPNFFAKALEKFDEITVPCQWNLETFKKYTTKKIHVLPHLPQFNGLKPRMDKKPSFLEDVSDNTYVFLNVSNWTLKKNIEKTILTFGKAFNEKDDVLFIFKTSERDVSKRFWTNLMVDLNFFRKTIISFNEILKKHNIKAKFKFIGECIPEEQMNYLYDRADCYFTMTHAEGWGMGSYESAFYGKPVIATDYSGHLDYLKPENSYLIPPKMIPIKLSPWDDKIYYKGFTTADPDMDDAIDKLRYVYNNREKAIEKGILLKTFVEKEFSETKISNTLKDILN